MIFKYILFTLYIHVIFRGDGGAAALHASTKMADYKTNDYMIILYEEEV